MKRRRERLHKYIAGCGYCSRRRAERLIERGLVLVNGSVVRDEGHKITPGQDVVTIHGEEIVPPQPLTIVLNKPGGTITSTHDTHDRLTVMDLLPKKVIEAGVLPAGRLDLDTEGLLILTNDGELLHRITHPRYECEKEYRVVLSRAPTRGEKNRLEEGLYLPQLDRVTAHAHLFRLHRNPDGTASLHVAIREGMKRQVRRMFEEIGIKVTHLERLAIGGFRLKKLPRGEWRELTPQEIDLLTQKPQARPGRGGTARRKGPPRSGARRVEKPSREGYHGHRKKKVRPRDKEPRA